MWSLITKIFSKNKLMEKFPAPQPPQPPYLPPKHLRGDNFTIFFNFDEVLHGGHLCRETTKIRQWDCWVGCIFISWKNFQFVNVHIPM